MKNKKQLNHKMEVYEKSLMLKLSSEEKQKLFNELVEIVDGFEKYNVINLDNVEPTHFSVLSKQILRKDEIVESSNKKAIIECSKNYRNGFVCIKNE